MLWHCVNLPLHVNRCRVLLGIFLLQVIHVLSLLIVYPDMALYSARCAWRFFFFSSSLTLQKIKLSSANNRWQIKGAPLHIQMLVINLFCLASEKRAMSHFVHIRNKQGEMGFPCLSLLDGWIRPFGSPLMIIERDVERTQLMINATIFSLRPIMRMAVSKKLGHIIICFIHVQFDCHITYLAMSFSVKIVHFFMHNKDIVGEQSTQHKSTLHGGNENWHPLFQVVSNNFLNDLT